MCDYSLEMYQSRPAVAGERYESHRFHSGSIGFIAPGAGDVAICMSCDTELELTDIPHALQDAIGIPETARATFIRLDTGPHHDGLRFRNGAEITLQRLGPGVSAHIVDDVRAVPTWVEDIIPKAKREPEKVDA